MKMSNSRTNITLTEGGNDKRENYERKDGYVGLVPLVDRAKLILELTSSRTP